MRICRKGYNGTDAFKNRGIEIVRIENPARYADYASEEKRKDIVLAFEVAISENDQPRTIVLTKNAAERGK
ncbi:MAG: hypothetical protein LBK41_07725 [Clostridiales bacterium]|nr:hypothetical protein [Clostridiales bacterium]